MDPMDPDSQLWFLQVPVVIIHRLCAIGAIQGRDIPVRDALSQKKTHARGRYIRGCLVYHGTHCRYLLNNTVHCFIIKTEKNDGKRVEISLAG